MKNFYIVISSLAAFDNWRMPEEWQTFEKYCAFLLDKEYGRDFIIYLNEEYMPKYNPRLFADDVTYIIMQVVLYQLREIHGFNTGYTGWSWYCTDLFRDINRVLMPKRK